MAFAAKRATPKRALKFSKTSLKLERDSIQPQPRQNGDDVLSYRPHGIPTLWAVRCSSSPLIRTMLLAVALAAQLPLSSSSTQ